MRLARLISALSSACLAAAILVPFDARALVRVSGFSDSSLTFGTWSGSGNMERTDDLCVHNDSGTGYRITITTSTGGFRFSDGSHTLNFSVTFNSTPMTYGTGANFTGADQTQSDCGGGTNASLTLTVNSSDLSQATAGTGYSCVVYVTVAPNP